MNRIPINWLHIQGYCEVQIYLEKKMGVEARPTPEMELGRQKHEELYQQHLERAELKLSPEQAIKKASVEGLVLVSRELPVKGSQLIGIIDEVIFAPTEIWIIDDKPPDYPYFSNKLQVWGYCYAFEEQFQPKQEIIGALKHRDSQRIIWKEPFTDEHREEVEKSVVRILGILTLLREPEPTSNPNKCRSCRFFEACEYSPLKSF